MNVRSLWNNVKRMNICDIGVPKGEERNQKNENQFEKIRMKTFPNLVKKKKDIQI